MVNHRPSHVITLYVMIVAVAIQFLLTHRNHQHLKLKHHIIAIQMQFVLFVVYRSVCNNYYFKSYSGSTGRQ